MKRRTKIILAILFPVQLILINIIARFPHFVETYYSKGIYPYISKSERFLLGWIPFSVGDILYTLLVIFIFRWFFLRVKSKFKSPKKWIVDALSFLSVLYFAFHLLWGLNYYRIPLQKTLNIKKEYTTAELIGLTRKLIDKSNTLQLKITGDDSLKVDIPYDREKLWDLLIKGYENIEKYFPSLEYTQESVKPSLYSIALTYMGFNGYLNPLTNEAQVNTLLPKFKFPSTASHEVGHQLGFAKENEANFIACLVTMNHPDIYFRYGGYTFALLYCINELYLRKPEKAEAMMKTLNRGVMLNYIEMEKFWEAHKNPLEAYFKVFYAGYLKANDQPEGMKTYNYVVALLVNYFDQRDIPME